jgi:hypothetical protein
MAENKNKIIVYRDWLSTFDSLSDEEAGKLIKHFFKYINDLNPAIPDRLTGLLFEPLKQTLKRDLKKYEAICLKNKDNANMRWNENNANICERIEADAKHADSDSDSDSDSDNDKDKDKKKEKKTKYADFVSMPPDDYDKLILEHGAKNTKIFIEILNNYKGSTGKKYKSDYLTILNWVIDKAKKEGKYENLRVRLA